MNRSHPPRYPAPKNNGMNDILDVFGRLVALVVFAVSVIILLVVI